MSEGRGDTNFTLCTADHKLKSLEMETANLFYSYGILILLINFKIKIETIVAAHAIIRTNRDAVYPSYISPLVTSYKT